MTKIKKTNILRIKINSKLNYKALHNQLDKRVLKAKLNQDKRLRKTISFYRYVNIEANQALRDQLYIDLYNQEVLGRIYLANEGINAQVSILEDQYKDFINYLNQYKFFKDIPINVGLEENLVSFYKLIIKIRKKIVADGLAEDEIDFSQVGEHLSATKFNTLLDQPESIVVDVRNHYESEIGHFENAILVDCDTFREQLPMLKSSLQGKEDKQILLYCTGGIRCEKASAYLKHYGFKQVGQLYGGIIGYNQAAIKYNLHNKFKGKNFVFDHRLGERVSNEIISKCHQCGQACDEHTNCKNDDCHLLFIQCKACSMLMDGCCSDDCKKIYNLPIEKQRILRKGSKKTDTLKVYKSRIRPKLNFTKSM